MSQYSRNKKISEETKDDAQKMARGTQRPGQTKEQTKLIAQGIQKGIDLYKKQQKVKARELDKKLRKVTLKTQANELTSDTEIETETVKTNWLPWLLLLISWSGFAAYSYFTPL